MHFWSWMEHCFLREAFFNQPLQMDPTLTLILYHSVQFSSVQSLSHVRLFANPWTTARQASLSVTNSQSLPIFMSIELVMPSNHLILCRTLLLLPSIFPSIMVFSNESVLYIRWPQYWRSETETLVLPMNIQDWFPLGRTGWISLQSKRLSRVFSSTTVQKHQRKWQNPLQYSCPENPMDGEAWWATVHGVAKSWTQLSDFTYLQLSL